MPARVAAEPLQPVRGATVRWYPPVADDVIDLADTIVAIASPTSPGLRGIVRISGAGTSDVLSRLGVDAGAGRRARRWQAHVDLGDPLGFVPVDVLHWPTTRSYTGQPSAELHTMGCLPILTALVDAVAAAGARAARPGEFTLRSFLAGRLDLTQAEAVLGVIEAEQRGSLDAALGQLAGNLSGPLQQIRGSVLDLIADVEAGLDFVDEDIQFISDTELIQRLNEIGSQLDQTSQTMTSRGGGAAKRIVAIRGEPNAGKSCLINRLAAQEVAIVADIAGTTRDAVTVDVTLGDMPVTLVDTAGIDDDGSHVTQASQDQALRASGQASIRLWCVDASRDDFQQAARLVRDAAESDPRRSAVDLWVATKADLVVQSADNPGWIACSAVTGAGIETLRSSIADALAQQDIEQIGSVIGTAARCRQSIETARAAVSAAIALTQAGDGHELVSAELRTIADALGEVTGAIYTDDILDRVFGRFCIGK